MPGMDPTIFEHHIDTWLDASPVWQKQRPIHTYKALPIKSEIDELRKAEFIYPIAYTSWVYNTVPVNKK